VRLTDDRWDALTHAPFSLERLEGSIALTTKDAPLRVSS
jgi:hypothetical protein